MQGAIMTNAADATGILIISHGSPRAEANQGFVDLVGRIAARLGTGDVRPVFFSIARPNIQDQVAAMAARGLRRIVLMPYFLYSGQHVTVDIPAQLAECRAQFPQVTLELLPTLENDPALEDVVVERLTALVADEASLPTDGRAIEERSYQIIARQLQGREVADPAAGQIIRRIIHATADVSFARTLAIDAHAVERGQAALAAGKPILCDVRMVQAGITKTRNEVACLIDDEEVRAMARQNGITRAAAAMEKFVPRLEGAIVAVGNAPTALWRVMEIARRGGPRPALVVGIPVGFVGARESKLALIRSGLCYITNTSARGGSPVVAAAVNALAMLSQQEQ
jgi:precorrin-8X/cobalt-precorrin-8 methylmutase